MRIRILLALTGGLVMGVASVVGGGGGARRSVGV